VSIKNSEFLRNSKIPLVKRPNQKCFTYRVKSLLDTDCNRYEYFEQSTKQSSKAKAIEYYKKLEREGSLVPFDKAKFYDMINVGIATRMATYLNENIKSDLNIKYSASDLLVQLNKLLPKIYQNIFLRNVDRNFVSGLVDYFCSIDKIYYLKMFEEVLFLFFDFILPFLKSSEMKNWLKSALNDRRDLIDYSRIIDLIYSRIDEFNTKELIIGSIYALKFEKNYDTSKNSLKELVEKKMKYAENDIIYDFDKIRKIDCFCISSNDYLKVHGTSYKTTDKHEENLELLYDYLNFTSLEKHYLNVLRNDYSLS